MASNKRAYRLQKTDKNPPKYVDKYTVRQPKNEGNEKTLWPENSILTTERSKKRVNYLEIEEGLDRYVFILPKKTSTKKTSKSPLEVRLEWFQSLPKTSQALDTNKVIQPSFPGEIKFDCLKSQTGNQLIDVETIKPTKSIPPKTEDLIQAGTFTLGRDETEMMAMEAAMRRLTVTMGTKEDKREVYLPDQLEKVNKYLWDLDFPSLKIEDCVF
jgi:hypothetical protein